MKNLYNLGDDDKNHITKEELGLEEYEYTKSNDSWGGDIQINIFCILFNYDVAVFKEYNGKYKRYFLFHIPEINPEELVILLYENNNHYNIIYLKFKNAKNNIIYNDPKDFF